jgi:hypothetical protein
LRAEELGALLWILEKASHPDYRLKLGMGKPYGMGAVQIVMDQTKSRLIDRHRRYTGDLVEKEGWVMGEEARDSQKLFDSAKDSFVRWAVSKDDPDASISVEQFEEHEVVRDLLKLLSWPGPNRQHTSYMSLDEHKTKPVLPKASEV